MSAQMVKKVMGLLGIALLVSLIFYGYLQSKNTSPRVLSYSIENSLDYVSFDEVDDILYPFLAQGFWKVDLLALQQTLENLAWISSAEVQRYWPANLKIKIREHQPIARWGEQSLVTADGVVFQPQNLVEFDSLVHLDGDLLQVPGVLNLLNEIPPLLAPFGWMIVDLRQNIDGVLTIQLDNGLMLIVDQANWSSKIQRFVRAYPLVDEKRVESALGFDLRNTNGFAIILPSKG
ncbi:cell division protein FtsQ/DivIB [Thiomicrospira microaerophila]|uniref:cell division protein FtsQ/DivIB n=1 Tax=Thiomicrospira microaerophila TaxID=406020 RepID=UPI00200C2189|nr:cell division protein FtsQ/DivIB [Thiomicrospira microaerophila]UQB42592.1 cell division protein FtsQ/DivIB [Thiomicrospira microaerophila]